MRNRPVLVAAVQGFPAFLFDKVLAVGLPDRLAALEELAASRRVHPDLIAEVHAAWEAIRTAAAEWESWRSSADGSAEGDLAEMPPRSEVIDTDGAAVLLRVTSRRVRQLISSGELPARKSGQVWLVDRRDVELYRGVRQL